MSNHRFVFFSIFSLLVILIAIPFVVRATVRNRYKDHIYEIDTAPEGKTALVFGAAVRRGWLSTVLRDRMDTAVELYHRGVIDEIIVSGHQDELGYDEPGSMKSYAVARGIPAEAVTMDTLGDRTYDSCYRARHQFNVDSVLLVTQAFHLPRALLTCELLGIEAYGVKADLRTYRGGSWYEMRETAATLVAIADLIRKDPPSQTTTASIDLGEG